MKKAIKKAECHLICAARFLHISIPYDKDDEFSRITFDDGVMTELECEDDFIPPMLNKETDRLEVTVDLKERKVIDWAHDEYIRMWAKVCDSGTYTLFDAAMKPLWQINGYVPNAMIPPYENGFGDYLELAIECDGTLLQWQTIPDFSDFIKDGETPKPIRTNKWHRAEGAFYDVMGHKLNNEEVIWLLQRLMAKYTLTPKEILKEILY